ncbi:hypothetical protein EMIHUDRAFT_470593 [Emiliania huxleyi CCMP1516]|uniref:SGNH hydrolase-type esterase domain-containing protein n=2 Tax=Emiliania huxleyi TaxID=2903 RepID=A0A0D3IV20_EMIH1|nr:hypothetical protein EMIHUDRAFT_470593 [Emiliania huxleyi CCMP1516]EOD15105.1 hypothetical protein EMIHUDRAFT_470593 [Emiliania huxleyi CCMP1516]|eukprot:XP_005767534.1 hypothetical protein EMIHUDRAFT_470593 [Emiliania huxleyi CCMP1516]
MSPSTTTPLVGAAEYYSEYYGHNPNFLRRVHASLRGGGSTSRRSCIFLAGDSSLDNKFWFDSWAAATNGYEAVLAPGRMKTDVCYWLNDELVRRGHGGRLFCLNTAVEATSLNTRACGRLTPQDRLIASAIGPDDVLVVSVGGNDIALEPLLFTALNLSLVACCTPQVCIEQCACACPPNLRVDPGCACCGLPGCLVSPCGCPPGLGYLVDLFGNRVQNYIERLLAGRRPARVVVCMIYFLDVHGRGSWADCFLKMVCYDSSPARLQAAIRALFSLATRRVAIPGVEVVPFPLFEALDGSDPRDYVQRVEPSPEGGRKMAAALLDAILDEGGGGCYRRTPAEMQR